MKHRLLAILLGLGLFAPAIAQINEEAYEVEAGLIRLPVSISGSVILRECQGCEQFTHRVTAATSYRINGTRTTLAQLKEVLPQAVAAGGIFVVAYDIETRNVTFVALDI
ncbi:MAG: hypothetical protein AAFX44_04195 [Pseudomonadota bacterium]